MIHERARLSIMTSLVAHPEGLLANARRARSAASCGQQGANVFQDLLEVQMPVFGVDDHPIQSKGDEISVMLGDSNVTHNP